MPSTGDFIQTMGKKKTAIATARVTKGTGDIRLNGAPIELIRPEILRNKVQEPLEIAGKDNYKHINIACSVQGGGDVAQLYAIRQAIAKAIIASMKDEAAKENLRKAFVKFDRHLIVADNRVAEAKKFGGRGARARR